MKSRGPAPPSDAPASRPLRIAMLGCKGIPARHGGVERHVEEIAIRLVQRGHHVDVFNRGYHPVRAHTYAGVQLRRRPSLNTKHFDAASHTALCALETAISRRYDVLHVHGLRGAQESADVRLTPRARVCVSPRSPPFSRA